MSKLHSPGPDATLLTITMTVQMPSAALGTKTVTKYVKNVSLRGQMTFTLENKDIIGLAARSKHARTTMIQ